MAHLDAINPNMENLVNNELKKLDLTKIKTIYIWKGSKCYNNCPSYILAKKITQNLGNKEIIYLQSNNNIIRI